jgi:hypothetical protein
MKEEELEGEEEPTRVMASVAEQLQDHCKGEDFTKQCTAGKMKHGGVEEKVAAPCAVTPA